MGAIDTNGTPLFGTTTFAVPYNSLEAIYVGYFGRGADAGGLAFWITQYNAAIAAGEGVDQALNNIANSFAFTPEALSVYPLLASPVSTLTYTGGPTGYGQLGSLVNSIYENLFDRAANPTGDLSYWVPKLESGAIYLGDAIVAIANGAIGADLTTLDNKIYVASEFTSETGAANIGLGTEDQPLTPAFLSEAASVVTATTSTTDSVTEALGAITAFVDNGGTSETGPGPGQGAIFTLTENAVTLTGYGYDVFNANLVSPEGGDKGQQPTLVSSDSLTEVSPATGAVLNAQFNGADTIRSVNIVGIETWNIEQTANGKIDISADGPGGPNIISGLQTLNFDDDSTSGSLSIGDNGEPVQEPNGANGFTIQADSAVGDGYYLGDNGFGSGYYHFHSPGVDVDIAAGAFTGTDTINIIANEVGTFQETSDGSYMIPPPILGTYGDPDSYNPNWVGYLSEAFSFAAGASAGPLSSIGFQNWVVTSEYAATVGVPNIIALGGEGSTTATTLTVINPVINGVQDHSNTILFATAISDSLSTDWMNLKTITLNQTDGFVTLTGLETDVAEVGISTPTPSFIIDSGLVWSIPTTDLDGPDAAYYFAEAFSYYDGGGLLASDTTALTEILGGTGNSFYDLSSLTPATVYAATLIQGGSSHAGNSEVAFNNAVMTYLAPTGSYVNIQDIQILDDVSSIGPLTVSYNDGTPSAILEDGGEAQGGEINMNDFPGLLPLNVPYALIGEQLTPDGGLNGGPFGATVPFGLPFTEAQFLFTPPASQAALLAANGDLDANAVPPETPGIPSISAAQALDLQNGVVPAGYQLLQLLNAEGSTQTVLGAKLIIENGPVDFAINMQDTADGTLMLSHSGDEEEHTTGGTWSGFDITITEQQPPSPNTPDIVNIADTLILFVSDDGAYIINNPTDQGAALVGTALYVPQLVIDNYSTVDIVLPFESSGTYPGWPPGGNVQNYVILGAEIPTVNQPGFDVTPVVTEGSATVNFFDNHADQGGSPPGGPDDLVLGYTNFTGTLDPFGIPSFIGITSVSIDTVALDFATTINDYGAGSLEIGATNVTNLNAQSTSHLIMDLPGTNTEFGIDVNGSLLGQNLLQGTSGQVIEDPVANGHNPTGTDTAAVFEVLPGEQAPGVGWGNDILTGGDGFGTVVTTLVGGEPSETVTAGVSNGTVLQAFDGATFGTIASTTDDYGVVTYGTDVTGPGNTGDNFFPEGGNDVVNIAAGEIGTVTGFQKQSARRARYSSPHTLRTPTLALCGLGSTTCAIAREKTPEPSIPRARTRVLASSMTKPSRTLVRRPARRPSSTATVRAAWLRTIRAPHRAHPW
jgi:hypothetical protein